MIAAYELGRWLRAMCRNGVGGSPTRQHLVIRRHADDLERRAVRPARSERLADRALAGPVAARERFVDDRHARRVRPIARR